jgi:hypothetical protein
MGQSFFAVQKTKICNNKSLAAFLTNIGKFVCAKPQTTFTKPKTQYKIANHQRVSVKHDHDINLFIDKRSFQAEPIVCKTHGLHIDVVTRVANHIASRLSRDSTPLIHMHISCMYPIHIVYMYTSSIKHMHIYFYYVYNIYHTPSIHRRVTKFKTSNRKHDMHNNITG